jgi:hypothetical protein
MLSSTRFRCGSATPFTAETLLADNELQRALESGRRMQSKCFLQQKSRPGFAYAGCVLARKNPSRPAKGD